uniref:Ubiquitin-like domain-containing protein n=1 Tax=Chromera velia CCMP2878 TaxID=1169474 RepID=A0A0G4HSQ8_9ALVE|eukprot:Cvel_8284.t1-p1 / transcript=Cvel_8284.t1 / gene=Cvel_8284 / organism=Chromera_velia_CCMP2878 / gene_product=hypothetical protein / transcript_product=hypothetical protein / location=Cvel_scaffold454:65754-66980(-) / protein_length=409 / sequence_SO=supercontig / SO=protein_coding / is_pseudo=false
MQLRLRTFPTGSPRQIDAESTETVDVLYEKVSQQSGINLENLAVFFVCPDSHRVTELKDRSRTLESYAITEGGYLEESISFRVKSKDFGDPLIFDLEGRDAAVVKRCLGEFRRNGLGLYMTDEALSRNNARRQNFTPKVTSALHRAIWLLSESRSAASLSHGLECLKEVLFSGICSRLFNQRDRHGLLPLEIAEEVSKRLGGHQQSAISHQADQAIHLVVEALDARKTAALLCRMELLVREGRAASSVSEGRLSDCPVKLFLKLDTSRPMDGAVERRTPTPVAAAAAVVTERARESIEEEHSNRALVAAAAAAAAERAHGRAEAVGTNHSLAAAVAAAAAERAQRRAEEVSTNRMLAAAVAAQAAAAAGSGGRTPARRQGGGGQRMLNALQRNVLSFVWVNAELDSTAR